MGTYDGILRVRKWELDEQRRALRAEQDMLGQMDQALQALADDVAGAQDGVDPTISALSLGAFLEGARLKEKDLLVRREQQQAEVDKHQQLVQSAFQDLKTIEIAAEEEARQQALERSRKDQSDMDEIAARMRPDLQPHSDADEAGPH